ncbi:YggT family protein [Fictibacillus fluitans]|uniref:YggT family protein n=1 Tax=Fictibacillus fluitans TaxID=3058422 RepID=A0ABT8I2C7_9BACL|nr:YggT family protein [Fictibacillus sp. NE201]MDN4527134.1 YggT family protein [Fictibacillus sp. NE201]
MGSIILQAGQYIYDIFYWLMIIFIIGSWFPQFHATRMGMWIGNLVEPYFGLFRRFIPPIGVIDISVLIALIAYRYLGGFALAGLGQVVGMFS